MSENARVTKRERTTLHEKPAQGEAARKAIESILDEGVFCFVALVGEDGQPYAFPTLYGRDDDAIYLHGGKQSHVEKTAIEGKAICATVALLDGYAFARANIEHHAHYRSVMIFGTPTQVTEVEARRHAMPARRRAVPARRRVVPAGWHVAVRQLVATAASSRRSDEAAVFRRHTRPVRIRPATRCAAG